MLKYRTIQKLSDEVGLSPSFLRKLLENGTLTKHYLEGSSRILIDIDEFNSKVSKNDDRNDNGDVDYENFLIS